MDGEARLLLGTADALRQHVTADRVILAELGQLASVPGVDAALAQVEGEN